MSECDSILHACLLDYEIRRGKPPLGQEWWKGWRNDGEF